MSTIWLALWGGILIGLAATLLLAVQGRVLGISGIVSELIIPTQRGQEQQWRWVFLLGLLACGLVLELSGQDNFASSPRSVPLLLLAGLCVGYGTRLGNGCTSGHGVCGISRFSLRSIVATLAFMSTGILTVWLLKFW